MKTLPISILSALCICCTAPLMAATFSPNAVALSLSDDGRSITTIAGRGTGSKVKLTFAGGNISLDDIDYRPATGGVFGYDHETATVYSINLATGMATAEVSNPGVTNSGTLGFDFNNFIDAARVVTDTQNNVVYSPNAMGGPTLAAAPFPLFYKAGDVNAGQDPTVIMNAYTNAVIAPATTVQYVIDTGLDVLATLNNNMGDLTTIGSLFLGDNPFEAQGDGGFDIFSLRVGDTISNTAYALLSTGTRQSLYTFSFAPDALGRINLFEVSTIPQSYGALAGLTVMPSAVPVPASALLLLGGIGLLAGAARRRRA